MPLGFFLLQPYAAAHAAPGFLTQQLQGFIFGLANNILGITMWIGAWGVGFKAWDQLNFFVVMFGVAVSFFNTVFFLGFGLSPELQAGSVWGRPAGPKLRCRTCARAPPRPARCAVRHVAGRCADGCQRRRCSGCGGRACHGWRGASVAGGLRCERPGGGE